MDYLYTDENNDISSVTLEKWEWEAHYNDGTVLRQFQDATLPVDKGVFHQFREIDQSKLSVFKMVSRDEKHSFVLPFDPSRMKLIHFYINSGINLGTQSFTKLRWYVYGYESNGVKHLNIITHNGEVILCEDPRILQV